MVRLNSSNRILSLYVSDLEMDNLKEERLESIREILLITVLTTLWTILLLKDVVLSGIM